MNSNSSIYGFFNMFVVLEICAFFVVEYLMVSSELHYCDKSKTKISKNCIVLAMN